MTKTRNNVCKLLLALCVVAALALAVLGGGYAFGTSAKADGADATPHLFLKEGAYNQGNNAVHPYTGKVLPQGYVYAIDADSDGCTYIIEIHANVCHYMAKFSGYGNSQWFNVPLYYGVEDGESELIAAGSDYLGSKITMTCDAVNGNNFIAGQDCSKGDGIAFTYAGNYAKHPDYQSIVTVSGGNMGTVKARVKCVTEFSDNISEPLVMDLARMGADSKHLVELKFKGETGFDFSSESVNKVAGIHQSDNITRNHIQFGKNAVGESAAINACDVTAYNTAASTNINININAGSIEFIRYNNANPVAETEWQEGEYIILKTGMQLANYYGPEGAPLTAPSGKAYKLMQDVKYVYNGTAWVKHVYQNDAWVNVEEITGVTLSETAKELEAGTDFDLTATVAGGSECNTAVTWTTSDDSVATVANGKVTAVAEGTATITATSVGDPTKTAECAITVTAARYLFLKEGAYNQGNNAVHPYTGKVLPQGYVYAIDADSDGCTYVIEIHANVCHYMAKFSGYGNSQWFNVPLYYGYEDGENELIAAGSDYLGSKITMTCDAVNGNNFIAGQDCSKGDGIAFTYAGNYFKHADYQSIVTVSGGNMGTVKIRVKCVTEFSDNISESLVIDSARMGASSKHLVELVFAGTTGFDFSSESANKVAGIHASDNITRNHIQFGRNAVGDTAAINACDVTAYNTAAGTNINININAGSIEFIRYNNADPAAETEWQAGEYIVLKAGLQLANYYGPEGAPLTAPGGKAYKLMQDVKYVYDGENWVSPTEVGSVTLSGSDKTELEVGEEITLTATVAGGGAHDTTVTWSTSDPAVATVENGKITAVAAGTVTITATANGNNTKTAEYTVTVKAKPAEEEPGKTPDDNPGDNDNKDNDNKDNDNKDDNKDDNTTTPTETKKKCGGNVAASATGAAIALVLAAGFVLVLRKRQQA